MLKCESRGPVYWLEIDRPEQMNQVTWELFPLLIDGIQRAQESPQTRAIVITGAGNRWFCGGGDLMADQERSGQGLSPHWLMHPLIQVFQAIEACTVPVVARVNGHAMAPGLSLLSMVDLAVGVEDAQFGLPEGRVGLVNTLGMAFLQRLLPKRKLLELILTAEPIGAQEALAAGLLNYVVPRAQLDEKLSWLLARLVDKSPDAHRRGKFAFKAMEDMTLDQAFRFGSSAAGNVLLTEDFREGVSAFFDKRAPSWARKE